MSDADSHVHWVRCALPPIKEIIQTRLGVFAAAACGDVYALTRGMHRAEETVVEPDEGEAA